LGAIKQLRDLVTHFAGSSQLAAALELKQQGQAGKRIKDLKPDVVTRWWSTYAMCKRGFYLRPYIALLVQEGRVAEDKFLSDAQWDELATFITVLSPFMLAQKFLEGEKYVTISLIPAIIWKIRSGLVTASEDDANSAHLQHICRKLLLKFNEE
jgi:hypothetical protein